MRFIFQTLLSFFLLTCLSVYFFSSTAFAVDQKENYAVIINQVRGESCCGPGSLENTKKQLETITSLGLKASFAIRYDALQDIKYTSLIWLYINRFPALIEPAAMIEIVPSLAKDAGVTYTGNDENWFHAQYAYTMGYEKADRKKLLDTYMTKFMGVFGKYPKTSSAWMMDTESANYLHEKYGVLSHQITREQWGTDSYTLYGGPFHYPYPASNKWIFLPDYEQENPLLIIRQTVTDPLYNYGDTNSESTSQPNDYARAGRDINYFKSLISNAFSQPGNQSGFILLGLENSMELVYQEEYFLQLKWLKDNLDKFNVQNVHPHEASIMGVFTKSDTSVYFGENNLEKAWNITTPNFRVRLIKKDEGFYITDLRYFDKNLNDPYTSKVAKYEAFWVAPFLIDGSRWYKPKKPYTGPHSFLNPQNDFASEPTSIYIPISDNNFKTQIDLQKIFIKDESGKQIFYFDKDKFTLPNDYAYKPQTPESYPITYKNILLAFVNLDKTPVYSATYKCKIFCEVMFSSKSITDLENIYTSLYPYLYPEPVDRNLSLKYSKISIHNRFAVAGRNPVRIILEPHDEFNFPIILHNDARITPVNKNVEIKTLGDLKKSQYQYVDFYTDTPLSSEIDVSLGDSKPYFAKKFTIFFSPNCKEDFGYCLKHPIQGAWYVITKISDWWEGRK